LPSSIKKTLKVVAISIGSIILLCGLVILVLVLNFKKPDILATDSIITFTEDGKILGKTTIKLSNDNHFSIKIDSLHYTMKIYGKTYLSGKKDSQLVLAAHTSSNFTLPYIVEAKAMDEDFKNEDSAVNHFLIDCYVSIWGIKKLHLVIPVAKKIAFLKQPVLISDHNYVRVNDAGIAKVNLVVNVANPNKYMVQMDSLTYSLFIEGQKYLNGEKIKKIELGPLDTQKINLPLTFNLKKFMKDFKGRDSAIFNFNVEVLISTPDIKKEHIVIPLHKKVPLITDINIEVNRVKINKLGLNNCELTAYVKAGNPNPVDLKANHLHYIVKVEGLQWADGVYEKTISLRKKSSIDLEFPIHLDTKKIAKSANDYLSGDKVQNYEIAADFNVKTPDPTLKNVKMDVKNSGILHLGKLIDKAKKK